MIMLGSKVRPFGTVDPKIFPRWFRRILASRFTKQMSDWKWIDQDSYKIVLVVGYTIHRQMGPPRSRQDDIMFLHLGPICQCVLLILHLM